MADNDFTVLIPLGYADALNVAEFLDTYGKESDFNIAENIRYVARQAKRQAEAAEQDEGEDKRL